jgi:beta-ribofuranosylaminobenzene 5'-phosphate synthase
LSNRPAPLATSVTVTVPARLHLGFLDPSGALGRRFGSIGLAIDTLRTRITVRRATHTHVDGFDSERAANHLDTMRGLLALNCAHRLIVQDAVPTHSGLGSGTQLALAVAAGLRRLHGLPLETISDAIRLGRGARSGIGIGLFDQGGFVVDGGHGPSSVTAPIITRLPFPPEWAVIVVLDPSHRGVSGTDERAAFAALTTFPQAAAAHQCALVLMKILPALAERDCAVFGSGVKELQARIGDYFAPAQGGGRFTSAAVANVLDTLDRAGAGGVGQSSWGPTGFAFARSSDAARRLVDAARKHPSAQGLDIRVCKALNHGADIRVEGGAGAASQ